MRISPHWMFAAAIVSIGGAVGGAAIGTTPIVADRGEASQLPTAPIIQSRTAGAPRKALPNHYALETPNGRIEVGELALHGRMRDSHAGMQWERERELADRGMAAYEREYSDDRELRIAHERALIAYTTTAEHASPVAAPTPDAAERPAYVPRPSRAEAPLALADPVSVNAVQAKPTTRVGNAKMIDISASLSN